MGGACSRYGGEERSILGLGGETSGKISLGRPMNRWDDNINPYPANVEYRVGP
jgi:hypothetical protein